jgi:hypothetical protein
MIANYLHMGGRHLVLRHLSNWRYNVQEWAVDSFPANLGWLCDTIDLLVCSFGHDDQRCKTRSCMLHDLLAIKRLPRRLRAYL